MGISARAIGRGLEDMSSLSHDIPMSLRECETQTQQMLRSMSTAESELFDYLTDMFHEGTAIIRESGEEEPDKTAHSRLLTAASAPILLAMEPFLDQPLKDSQNCLMLGLLGYPTRFRSLRFNKDIARGYMVERMVCKGNIWERPHLELEWLGANVMTFAILIGELQKRQTVEREIIEAMMPTNLSLCEGTL